MVATQVRKKYQNQRKVKTRSLAKLIGRTQTPLIVCGLDEYPYLETEVEKVYEKRFY